MKVAMVAFGVGHDVSITAIVRSTSLTVMPTTRIIFFRLLMPAAMVTDERGTFKNSAKKRMQASLALPSTGGEVSSTFRESPTIPEMRSRRALG